MTQPKQEQDEPVGQLLEDAFGRGQVMWFNKPEDESMLYTTPQQRTWVGLTDVEWMNIVNKNQAWFGMQPDEVAHEVCKLTEAKLKDKNL